MQTQFASPFSNQTRRSFIIGAGAIALAAQALTPLRAIAQNTAAPGFEILDAQVAFEGVENGAIILVDIRRPDEWADTGIAEGAIALDMREQSFVASLVRLRELYPERPIALICRTGMRSNRVTTALAGQGFPGLVDVAEGMVGGPNGTGWIPRGLPVYAGIRSQIAPRLAAVMTP